MTNYSYISEFGENQQRLFMEAGILESMFDLIKC